MTPLFLDFFLAGVFFIVPFTAGSSTHSGIDSDTELRVTRNVGGSVCTAIPISAWRWSIEWIAVLPRVWEIYSSLHWLSFYLRFLAVFLSIPGKFLKKGGGEGESFKLVANTSVEFLTHSHPKIQRYL